MRTILLQAFIILFTSTQLLSQDGTIINRERLDLMKDPELAKRLLEFKNESWILKPEFSYLEEVVVEKIIYSSDGLKITGYLAYPVLPDSLPVIIYNRGGNREFGALNPRKIAFILAKLASSGYVVIGSQYRGTDGNAHYCCHSDPDRPKCHAKSSQYNITYSFRGHIYRYRGGTTE